MFARLPRARDRASSSERSKKGLSRSRLTVGLLCILRCNAIESRITRIARPQNRRIVPDREARYKIPNHYNYFFLL